MKSKFLFYYLLLSIHTLSYNKTNAQSNNDEITKLKFSFYNGYAEEEATTMSNFIKWIDKEDLKNTSPISYQKLRGIPSSWKNVKFSTIIFDELQYYHQLLQSKKIDSLTYKQQTDRFQRSLYKPIDNIINCYVYLISGTNTAGEAEIIIDSNNNKDFSDDEHINFNRNPEAKKNGYQKNIKIQFATDIGVKEEYYPIKIFYRGKEDDPTQITYNFPTHGIAHFEKAGKNYEIKFISLYALSLNFLRTQFFVRQTEKLNSLPIEQEEFIRIDNEVFQNVNIDIRNKILYLKKIKNDSLSFPKVGFNAPNFKIKEINNNTIITLDKYKGRYLLIDFWATWCPPCVTSMLELKEKHEFLSQNNVSILGINIAAREELATAKKTIQTNGFIGEQIFSAELTTLYKVGAIPSNFLIDPNGKIVAIDINISKLEIELKKILK